jgi:hypothetical protein
MPITYRLVIVGKRLKIDDPHGDALIVDSIGPVAIHHLALTSTVDPR